MATAKRKFRVYVEFTARICTDVEASDKETVRAEIEKIDLAEAVRTLGGRDWQCLETSGGVSRVSEVVKVTREMEV